MPVEKGMDSEGRLDKPNSCMRYILYSIQVKVLKVYRSSLTCSVHVTVIYMYLDYIGPMNIYIYYIITIYRLQYYYCYYMYMYI